MIDLAKIQSIAQSYSPQELSMGRGRSARSRCSTLFPIGGLNLNDRSFVGKAIAKLGSSAEFFES